MVTFDELKSKSYKTRVNLENRDRDYTKFAVSRDECSIVIKQNIVKGHLIAGSNDDDNLPDEASILENHIDMLKNDDNLYVLCTCAYYIHDYNSKLIEDV